MKLLSFQVPPILWRLSRNLPVATSVVNPGRLQSASIDWVPSGKCAPSQARCPYTRSHSPTSRKLYFHNFDLARIYRMSVGRTRVESLHEFIELDRNARTGSVEVESDTLWMIETQQFINRSTRQTKGGTSRHAFRVQSFSIITRVQRNREYIDSGKESHPPVIDCSHRWPVNRVLYAVYILPMEDIFKGSCVPLCSSPRTTGIIKPDLTVLICG